MSDTPRTTEQLAQVLESGQQGCVIDDGDGTCVQVGMPIAHWCSHCLKYYVAARLREQEQLLQEFLANSGDPNAVTGEFDTTAGRARRLLGRP